jgi:hypothetical protein
VSTHDGPSRRRRIAGESKPDAPRPPASAAKKVVRRPVARPGAPAPGTAGPEQDEPTASAAPVEEAPVEQAPVEETGTAEPTTTDETTAAPAAPKVAPRVGRRRPREDAPDDDAAEPAAPAAGESATSDDEPAEAATRRRPPVTRLLLALVAVAAVVFGAFFGYRGLEQWRDTNGIDSAHAKAAETAASAAETIFSYRYDQLETYLEDSRDVMTPSFARDFETISPALQDLAPQRRIQVTATTRDAAALPCGDDCSSARATVLVFVDQARLADGAETPTVFGNRVEMTMVERDGRWLVDDIKAL